MEVLEHCPDDVQVTVLDQILNATAPGGTVVISVPIEIGPPLLAKQGARALVALRGLSEYATRERYQPAELVRMLFAGAPSEPRQPFSLREEVPGRRAAARDSRAQGSTGAGCSARSSSASTSSDGCSRRCRFSEHG